jgi:hypothetical protein
MKFGSTCAGLVALTIQTFIASDAVSAEIKSVPANNGRMLVLITGEIVSGVTRTPSRRS